MEEFELYSYEELKEFILQGIIEESNEKNILDFKQVFLDKNKEKINILYKKLLFIQNKLNTLSILNNIILYSDHYIEIPIFFPNKFIMTQPKDPSIFIEDKINNINYTMSYQSNEYSLLMLNYFYKLKKRNKNNIEYLPVHFYLAQTMSDHNSVEYEKINLFQNIFNIFDTFTIKITTINKMSLLKLEKIAKSFLFQMVIDNNTPCAYYSNIFEIFSTNKYFEEDNIPIKHLSATPKQIYREHIIDYYSLALSSNEPFSQYLSYYHVLEYFFDEVFDKKIFDDFKENIQNNSDFITNENKQKEIIKKLKKDIRNNNELKCLELVLRKFVKIIELQDKLKSEQIKYFQQHKITFSDAPTISFKDKRGFYIQLAQRIYQTRNALVHSKENHVGRYKPYQDSEELNKEIPLIKLIAELVIINSSEPL